MLSVGRWTEAVAESLTDFIARIETFAKGRIRRMGYTLIVKRIPTTQLLLCHDFVTLESRDFPWHFSSLATQYSFCNTRLSRVQAE